MSVVIEDVEIVPVEEWQEKWNRHDPKRRKLRLGVRVEVKKGEKRLFVCMTNQGQRNNANRARIAKIVETWFLKEMEQQRDQSAYWEGETDNVGNLA